MAKVDIAQFLQIKYCAKINFKLKYPKKYTCCGKIKTIASKGRGHAMRQVYIYTYI